MSYIAGNLREATVNGVGDRIGMSEERVKFYTAEILLALFHM